MKKISFGFFCLLLVSCGDTLVETTRGDSVTISKGRDFAYGINFKVIEIDSCEYVVAEEWQHTISIVHKQNCKYCARRAADLLTNK